MLRTLIIDDEPLARGVLRKLLAAQRALVLAGEAGTFAEASVRLRAGDYDVVLLDIQLRGGNGFDLVPLVRPGARIIFVTAFDQHAMRAFEVNALDYLLKPVTADRFATAVARLWAAVSPADAGDARLVVQTREAGGLAANDTVLVRTDQGDQFVPVADIAAVFSNGNYSDVQLRTGLRLFTRRAMKTWEELLPDHFVRVHRQAVVNLACVEDHRPLSRETIGLRVTGVAEDVGVSRHCVASVLARLRRLQAESGRGTGPKAV
jgi:two-component system LytT family response regulator